MEEMERSMDMEVLDEAPVTAPGLEFDETGMIRKICQEEKQSRSD